MTENALKLSFRSGGHKGPARRAFSCLLIFLLLASAARSQVAKYDSVLKVQLDSIGILDQQYRELANNLNKEKSDSLAKVYHFPSDSAFDYLMAMQEAVDKDNLAFIENVISRYGYPGKSLVGSPTNVVAFYVIQHSPCIKEYLPLLQYAAKKNELAFELVAMMEDRMLVEEEKDQVYGTQLWGNPVKDPVTGLVHPDYYFHSIADPRNVNKRRHEAGFHTTVEQYADEIGVPYRIKRAWWWKNR